MNKTAIVIGATGLVGQELVKQLIATDEYSKIKLFVRKSIHFDSSKIEIHQVNFDQINDWKDTINGDTIFCCLGTTLKKAKTKEVQFKIDHTYTLLTVKAALINGCKTVVLVSSLGANLKSSNFYLATKGQLEADLTDWLNFSNKFSLSKNKCFKKMFCSNLFAFVVEFYNIF